MASMLVPVQLRTYSSPNPTLSNCLLLGEGRGRRVVVQILTLIHFIIFPIIVLPFRREVSFIVVLLFYFVFFLLSRFLHLSGSPLTDCVLDGFY